MVRNRNKQRTQQTQRKQRKGFIPFVAVGMMALSLLDDDDENNKKEEKRKAEQYEEEETAIVVAALQKRRGFLKDYTPISLGRDYIEYERERARANVYKDYFSPSCIFRDYQFERIFRVTKAIAEIILQECALQLPFFRESYDATGRQSICPKVKLLMGLKLLAYGVSISSYVDYFQMGISTGHLCLKNLVEGITGSKRLYDVYMRQMNRSDAKKVSQLHKDIHGVEGMIGSLDCMHLGWKNCQQYGFFKKLFALYGINNNILAFADTSASYTKLCNNTVYRCTCS
jgi:Plant transposon protein